MPNSDRYNGAYVFHYDTFTLSCGCEFSFKDNGDEVMEFCGYHDSVLQNEADWKKKEKDDD